IWRIVAMPGHYVQWRVADVGTPKSSLKLAYQLEVAFEIFEFGCRRQKISRVGQAVRTNGAKVGQAESGSKVLADIAAGMAIRQRHAESATAGNDRNFFRLDVELSEFGGDL